MSEGGREPAWRDASVFPQVSWELLSEGVPLRFRARGRSMEPFIRDGDVLHVEPLRSPCARVGDVVFLKNAAGRVLVHRVVGRGRDVVWTRGDGALLTDEAVPPDRVVGRVVAIERNGRVISMDRFARRLAGLTWSRLWVVRRIVAGLRRRMLRGRTQDSEGPTAPP